MAKWLNFADHERALREAVQGLPPVIVFEGEEDHLRVAGIETVRAALAAKYPGIAESAFHGPASQSESAFDLAQLLQELNTSSLFASEKIVVFRRAQRMLFQGAGGETASKKGGPLEGLTEYLKNPAAGTWLLLEIEKNNKTRNVGKAIDACCVVPCPLLNRQGDVVAWLTAQARKNGHELDRNAADILFTAHGGNLGTLSGELEKLAIYAGQEKRITPENVRTFLSGTVEFSAFELTNAIERKDLKNALRYARLITGQGSRDQSGKRMDGEASAHQALAMIAGRLENILRARAVIVARGGPSEVAATLGIGPYQAEGLYAAANLFRLAELQNGLRVLADVMHSAHDTGADAQYSLERAVIAACGR